MAFPLTEIELHIEDRVLASAEKLLDNDQLQEISETDPGLWVAQVNSPDGRFEVEVLLKGRHVKAHTCECGRSDKKQYCEHVVTLLLHLLHETKKEIIVPDLAENVTVPKRVTIAYLLDLVEPNDLKQFIKQYASEDRHFSLLLKAKFAYLLPRTKDNEPIGQILANTIKAIKRPGKSLNRNDWKMLQKVLKTLLQQAEDSLFKKHYSDVYETLEAILQQLNPLLLVVDERKVLIESINQSVSLFKEIIKHPLAPELEDQIWELFLTESHKKVYFLYDLWDSFLSLLLSLANNKTRNEAFLDLIDEKLNDRFVQKNDGISAGLVNYKIQLFELQHNEAALYRYLEENISHPEVLKQAIHIARQKENWKQLQQLSQYAIATQKPDETELIHLQIQLLTAAVHQKKRKQIRQLTQVLFLQTNQLEYFQLLKKTVGKKWITRRTDLLEQFQKQPSRLDKRKILAEIYAIENMPAELHQHLLHTQSLDLLKEYDALLFKNNIPDTYQLYRKIINHYLDNYMGRPAAIKVRESIEHLRDIGQTSLATELLAFVRRKYGDRKSLIEELS